MGTTSGSSTPPQARSVPQPAGDTDVQEVQLVDNEVFRRFGVVASPVAAGASTCTLFAIPAGGGMNGGSVGARLRWHGAEDMRPIA